MIPLTTMTAAKPSTGVWTAALYAGLFTAIIAVLQSLVFPRGIAWLWIPALILTGVGPVLGYQMARGRLFSDWKSIIGGLLGTLFFFVPVAGWVISMILWPILTGAMTKGQSIGKLILWSIIGFALALVAFSVLGFVMGQDPTMWTGLAWVVALSVWGGTVGAAMKSSALD